MSMTLNINLGDTVVAQVDGHSASNGALIPDGSTVALASNDPTIATVPATVPVPAGGAQSIPGIPVTVVATVAGSTDITCDVTAPDGSVFHDSATLIVAIPAPGLVSITLTLSKV